MQKNEEPKCISKKHDSHSYPNKNDLNSPICELDRIQASIESKKRELADDTYSTVCFWFEGLHLQKNNELSNT